MSDEQPKDEVNKPVEEPQAEEGNQAQAQEAQPAETQPAPEGGEAPATEIPSNSNEEGNKEEASKDDKAATPQKDGEPPAEKAEETKAEDQTKPAAVEQVEPINVAAAQEGAPEQTGQDELNQDSVDTTERERRALVKRPDEFYPDEFIAKPIQDSKISRRNSKFYSVMGFPSMKRYNVHFLTEDDIIFVVGNKYKTYNMLTKEFQTYDGRDTDGVGSIAVHPARKHFAVAEKGVHPNIYIYEYPSMRLYRILERGTEARYAHCEFSTTGDKLVSLGGAPDYTLTVWNWMSERVILKAKAFSQEVFRASFSPFSDDILFTSGFTHIRFWKMAQTFTGLKLQGEIAKYGQLELSDVSGYHELPDGKVLSGTEQGTLILWEGQLVKAHLVLDVAQKTPLHKGAIEVVLFEDDHFITAGTDGKVQWWSLTDVDNAEADEILEVMILPQKSAEIMDQDGKPAHIINMVRGTNFWLVQDFNGHLWKMDAESFHTTSVFEFHCGRINDMSISDSANMAVSVSQDGNVKFWDYVRQVSLGQRQFDGEALCVDLMRKSDLNKGRVAAVGYNSGIVRVVSISESEVQLAMAFKAHDGPVKKVCFAPSQTMLVTASENGEIFFFDVNGHGDLNKYNPLCIIYLPEKQKINDLKWDAKSSKIIVCCDSGYVYEIEKPKADFDNSESYEWKFDFKNVWKMKMMEFQMKKNQKKDVEEEANKKRLKLRGLLTEDDAEEDEDWDPDSITAITYTPDADKFYVGTQGQFAGYYYLCEFGSERPLQAFPLQRDVLISHLAYNQFGSMMIMGLSNGEIRISCEAGNPESFISIKQHDANIGRITAAQLSYDERFLISAGCDGLLFVHTIDKFMIQQESKFEPLADVEGIDYMPEEQVKQILKEKVDAFQEDNPPNLPDIDEEADSLDLGNLRSELRIKQNADDIEDKSIYSIQQSKLRTEEDHRLKLAEEKKQGVRGKVLKLRDQFTVLLQKNGKAEDVLQMSKDDFNIEPEYFDTLVKRSKDMIEETKREEQWEIEKNNVKLAKLKSKFYDVLDIYTSTVKALRTDAFVTTFRVPKMSDFLTDNIRQFKEILESEIAAKEENELAEQEANAQGGADQNQGNEQGAADKANKVAVGGGAAGQQQTTQHKTDAEKRREQRKIQREKRKKKIEKLKTKIVMHKGDNKEEQAKIEEAERTFGEYKLKMGSDYEVPEHEQIDYKKKRQQMILLEGSIHKLKIDFNMKITEFKLKKSNIIGLIEQRYEELRVINKELGVSSDDLIVPQIDEKVENPEKFFDVNDNDIEEYRQTLKQREIDAKNKEKGGKKKKQTAAEKEAEKKAQKLQEAEAAKARQKEDVKEIPLYERKMAERKGHQAHETALDDEMKEVRMIELQYEKKSLTDEVNKVISEFDESIKEMQKEKYRLESDLKNADLKLILLFEELILLKSMMPEDERLTNELKKCTEQKGLIIQEIQGITKKLVTKRNEIEEIKEEEGKLLSQFHELVDTNHEHYDQILNFYEKITKKKRRPEKVKNDDLDGDDDGDDLDEEEQEEDEDDDDDDNLNPQFGEDTKIDEIEKLRELRTELYNRKEKIQIYISELQTQQRKMESKQKTIDEDLTETEEQIRDFQKEKLAKLNQLGMSVVLKIKQAQNLERDYDACAMWYSKRMQQINERYEMVMQGEVDIGDEDRVMFAEEEKARAIQTVDWRGYRLPENLNDSILFTRTQLLQLIHRKLELEEEIKVLDEEQYIADQKKKEEKKLISQKRKDLEAAEREYQERQMLRFGNIVDLDSLEVSGPSQVVLDLQNKFHKLEKKCNLKKEEKEAELAHTQRELTKSIQMNTNLLDLIKQLGSQQLSLNKQLDSTNKQIFDNEDEEEKKRLQQKKDQFRETLEKQSKEIDILKTEINLYKKKGGHIYTKVTTNRRVAHLNDN